MKHKIPWADVYLRVNYHLDPSSHLAATNGPKNRGAVPSFGEERGERGPHLTQCGRAKAYLHAKSSPLRSPGGRLAAPVAAACWEYDRWSVHRSVPQAPLHKILHLLISILVIFSVFIRKLYEGTAQQ